MAIYKQTFKGNSTSAKLIGQEFLDVNAKTGPSGQLISLNVEVMSLPKPLPNDALVKMQLWDGVSETTEDLGTVASVRPLVNFDINEFKRPKLRVFVRETADPKLIAKSKWITVSSTAANEETAVGILPVEYRSLGEELWKLQLQPDDFPVILVNDRDDFDVKGTLTSDKTVMAFVLPDVLRQALVHLHQNQDSTDHEWVETWKQWVHLHGSELPPIEAEKEEILGWADECVSSFAKNNRLLSNLVLQD